MIKAVIFDLDGTLVESKDTHFYTLNRALIEISGIEISREEHEKGYNGLTTKTKLSRLTSEGRLDPSLHEQIWKRKQELTQQQLLNITPDKKVSETLFRLHSPSAKLNWKPYK